MHTYTKKKIILPFLLLIGLASHQSNAADHTLEPQHLQQEKKDLQETPKKRSLCATYWKPVAATATGALAIFGYKKCKKPKQRPFDSQDKKPIQKESEGDLTSLEWVSPSLLIAPFPPTNPQAPGSLGDSGSQKGMGGRSLSRQGLEASRELTQNKGRDNRTGLAFLMGQGVSKMRENFEEDIVSSEAKRSVSLQPTSPNQFRLINSCVILDRPIALTVCTLYIPHPRNNQITIILSRYNSIEGQARNLWFSKTSEEGVLRKRFWSLEYGEGNQKLFTCIEEEEEEVEEVEEEFLKHEE